MDHIMEGSARITIPGGREYKFTAQRVIRAAGKIPPYPGYSSLSALKNDLRRNLHGHEVTVRGVIYDTLSHRVLTHARIEVWHRSPVAEEDYCRACFTTDDYGQYHFITDCPDREKGKNYSIFFKITYKQKSFFTKMSFNHSLALISSISANSKSYNLPHEVASPIVPKKIDSSFQFNIGFPADTKDLISSQIIDIQ